MAPAALRPLCSLRGICTADAHPFWNLICLPVVLIARSLSIYFFPMLCGSPRATAAPRRARGSTRPPSPPSFTYVERVLRAAATYLYAKSCDCFLYKDDFSRRPSSIGDVDGDLKSTAEWVRAADLDPARRFQLFEGKIEPADLIQSAELGDCYLVAALACLAETPAAIRKIVREDERSARGKYGVHVYDGVAEKWTVVVVDDFVPVYKGTRKPAFIQPHGNELWAVIIEKALAKHCGSYHALEAGHTEWAWNALTGDPAFVLVKSADGASWARSKLVCYEADNKRGAYFTSTGETVSAGALFGVLQA